MDEERLRAERSDRKTWKSRVTGLEEYAPQYSRPPQRQPRERRRPSFDDEDAEYRLAIEASKHQEEEDRKRREGRLAEDAEDDDLAKAIKLSKEEEERRRRELEETNAMSLFDDTPAQSSNQSQTQTQPQYTGFNQGYQQGSAVDFFANPIDQNQSVQPQPTGYMPVAYPGFSPLPQQDQEQQQQQQQMATGFANGYGGYSMQPQMNLSPFGQQPHQQQATGMQGFQPQPTGYNIYQQQQSPSPQESFQQTGSNNPWASNNQQPQQQQPLVTGSNNPFAPSVGRSPTQKAPPMATLGTLPEQKTLSTFNQVNSANSFGPAKKDVNEHEAKLNALLSTGDGLDTFGNTGQLRIPAQHTAPGTFVNSAGAGAQRLTTDATGNNPFLRTQFTGMPTVSYGSNQMQSAATGVNGQGSNNPFAMNREQQQNNQNQDLIQF